VSAVTKQITVEDKYQKQLAELDLMAEDWIDTDEVSHHTTPLSIFAEGTGPYPPHWRGRECKRKESGAVAGHAREHYLPCSCLALALLLAFLLQVAL